MAPYAFYRKVIKNCANIIDWWMNKLIGFGNENIQIFSSKLIYFMKIDSIQISSLVYKIRNWNKIGLKKKL